MRVGIAPRAFGLWPSSMYIDFLGRAMDAVSRMRVAKVRYMSGGQATVPLTIRTQGGGGRSWGLSTGNSLEAWVSTSPGCWWPCHRHRPMPRDY